MEKKISKKSFISVFRDAGPYLNNLSGKTIVIGLSSYIIESEKFQSLIQDIALLNSLGIKIVLIFGVHKCIDENEKSCQSSVDKNQLIKIKEKSGRFRYDIEAILSMGYADLSTGKKEVKVVSSNYVSAKPKGIVDGVDMQFLGSVRKINTEAILNSLNNNEIVLISPLGYSSSGMSFYIPMSELASEIALTLKAEKLLFITRSEGIYDHDHKIASNLTPVEANQCLENYHQHDDVYRIYPYVFKSIIGGVKRVQLISGLLDGSILAELFTRDGVGTSLSFTSFTHIRQAKINDIPKLLQIITPLVEKGILLPRTKNYFERNIQDYFVIEFDEMIYGCVALRVYSGTDAAELVCLAVLESVQDKGYGELLLSRIIEEVKIRNKKKLFALTTQAADWFRERGFLEVSSSALPSERLEEYENTKRHSKVFVKTI